MEIDFYKLAADLAGRPVDRLITCSGGRNSRVYKVVSGGNVYALKSYPSPAIDPRDRLGTEVKALKFYEQNNNPYTPRLQAVDVSHGVTLMEWIDGKPIATPNLLAIDQAIDFISRTHTAEKGGGQEFGLASESCLCGSELNRHLANRLSKISAIAVGEAELRAFLADELLPILERARKHAQSSTFSTLLPQYKRSLIPADLGFHNAIRSVGEKIYFIDFEYFGWDDPVRLTADFILHPGMVLGEEGRERFLEGMLDVFKADEEFEWRLLQLLPLYGVRWVLILLNEFLPEQWQGRTFAGETASWEEIKERQLDKARDALGRVAECLTSF